MTFLLHYYGPISHFYAAKQVIVSTTIIDRFDLFTFHSHFKNSSQDNFQLNHIRLEIRLNFLNQEKKSLTFNILACFANYQLHF